MTNLALFQDLENGSRPYESRTGPRDVTGSERDQHAEARPNAPQNAGHTTARTTSDSIAFEVYGVAAPAGSKAVGYTKPDAFGNRRAFVRDASAKSAPWKRQVAQIAGEAMAGRQLLDGPLVLELVFYQARPKAHLRTNGQVKPNAPPYPTTKPDSTKLCRAVEDALIGVVYRDDAQIVRQLVVKRYGEPACCHVFVARELQP